MGPKSKIRHGSLMQNIVINMYGKVHDDRSRNDGALEDRKSDNNAKKKNNKNNVRSACRPVSGSKNWDLQLVEQEALANLYGWPRIAYWAHWMQKNASHWTGILYNI